MFQVHGNRVADDGGDRIAYRSLLYCAGILPLKANGKLVQVLLDYLVPLKTCDIFQGHGQIERRDNLPVGQVHAVNQASLHPLEPSERATTRTGAIGRQPARSPES